MRTPHADGQGSHVRRTARPRADDAARVNRAPLVVLVGQQDRRHPALEPFLTGRLEGLAGDYPGLAAREEPLVLEVAVQAEPTFNPSGGQPS